MNTTAIANHLNIASEAIIKIEVWANVLWVKFVGGCRFVSKKITGATMKKLTGTEKQIAWAEDIRSQFMDTLNTFATKAQKRLDKTGDQKFAQRLADIEITKKVISLVEDSQDFIRGRNLASLHDIERVTQRAVIWANLKGTKSDDEWIAIWDKNNADNLYAIDAHQGVSLWHLLREGVDNYNG